MDAKKESMEELTTKKSGLQDCTPAWLETKQISMSAKTLLEEDATSN